MRWVAGCRYLMNARVPMRDTITRPNGTDKVLVLEDFNVYIAWQAREPGRRVSFCVIMSLNLRCGSFFTSAQMGN